MQDSVVDPDVAVVLSVADDYARQHPRAADVGLLIEVAETRHKPLIELKQTMSAREAIPTFWIINLVERRVEVYTKPRAGRTPTYRQRTDYTVGQEIPVVLRGKKLGTIAVNEIIPQQQS